MKRPRLYEYTETLHALRKHAHAVNKQRISQMYKFQIFRRFFFYIFLIFAQNIDRGYIVEPPRRVPTMYVLDQK